MLSFILCVFFRGPLNGSKNNWYLCSETLAEKPTSTHQTFVSCFFMATNVLPSVVFRALPDEGCDADGMFAKQKHRPPPPPWDRTLMCPSLPAEVAAVEGRYDYQGRPHRLFVTNDVVQQSALVQSKTPAVLPARTVHVVPPDEFWANVCVQTERPTTVDVLCMDAVVDTFSTNTVYPLVLMAPLQLRVTEGTGVVHCDVVVLHETTRNELQNYHAVVFPLPTAWLTVTLDKYYRSLQRYDLANDSVETLAGEKPFSFFDTTSLRECAQLITLADRIYALPNGLTHAARVKALEFAGCGWYLHTVPVTGEEVLEALRQLYPQNRYALVEDCLITENGRDVASLVSGVEFGRSFFDETKCKHEMCHTNYYAFGDDGNMSFGIGRDCDGDHTQLGKGPYAPMAHAYLNVPEVSFPAIVFFNFGSLRFLDGRLLQLTKQDGGTLVCTVDDKVVYSSYQPSAWERHQLQYPGPYERLRFSETFGVTGDRLAQEMPWAFFDGLVMQSFPSQIDLRVPRDLSQRTLEVVAGIRAAYKAELRQRLPLARPTMQEKWELKCLEAPEEDE